MTDKITLGSIASFQNDATAVTQYNANNALITTALNNTLSRDGTSPNQLNAALDLNGNALLNGATTGFIAANLPFTPTGTVSSTNVQSAIAELDTEKVAISSLSNIAFSGAGVDMITTGVAWTPVLTFVTPGDLNVVYSTQSGRYYQLSSNLLLVQFNITTTTFTYTTASGNLRVTGLPFTTPNTAPLRMASTVSFQGINKASYNYLSLGMPPNSSVFQLSASGMGQPISAVASTDTASGTQVTLIGELIVLLS